MSDFHKQFPSSGVGKQFPAILDYIGSRPETRSILDFGCGKGGTADWIEQLHPRARVHRYEPGIEQYSSEAWKSRYWDCIYSVDVLEHIEVKDLEGKTGVLAWFNSCIRDTTFHIIDLDPAKKTLADGRNAHVTLLEPEEWRHVFDSVMCNTRTELHQYRDGRRRLHLWSQRSKKM